MRRITLIICAIALIIASCSQVEESANVEEMATIPSYNISFSEINRIDFSRMVSPQTKADNMLSKDITPVVEGPDTLMYVINYGEKEGWVLASADKRTPIILAISEEGFFDMDSISRNKGVTIWLKRMLSGIDYLKKHPEIIPDSSALNKWKDISPKTKGGNEHEGEWLQLVYVMSDTQLHYDINHLMMTKWGQASPWNRCTPLDNTGGRCLVGCGGVAAGQIAYYLHSKIGKPTQAPSYGVCTDLYTATPRPTITFTGYSSNTWDNMILNSNQQDPYDYGKNAVSAFLAQAAYDALTVFGPYSSPSSLSLYSFYFIGQGIASSYSMSFDSDVVFQNVLSGRPVMIGLVDPVDSTGHFAVIDGIQSFAIQYTYYYQWMPIGTFPPVEPEYPDLDHPENYVISDPYWDEGEVGYYYRINWGYDGYFDNAIYVMGDSWLGYSIIDEMRYNFH